MDTLIVAVRVVLSLGVVLALLWYLQRRLSRGALAKGVTNPVMVVGRQPLGQKASVVVIDVEGTRLVLGVTEQAVTVLHEASLKPATASDLDDAITSLGGPFVSPAPDADFAQSLATASASSTQLSGSILSPSTWRQTAALLRQRT